MRHERISATCDLRIGTVNKNIFTKRSILFVLKMKSKIKSHRYIFRAFPHKLKCICFGFVYYVNSLIQNIFNDAYYNIKQFYLNILS